MSGLTSESSKHCHTEGNNVRLAEVRDYARGCSVHRQENTSLTACICPPCYLDSFYVFSAMLCTGHAVAKKISEDLCSGKQS